jgi:selenocysteine lyase/cysteine desulfurase
MSEEGTRRDLTRRGLLVAGGSVAVAAGGYAAVREASGDGDDANAYVNLSTFLLAAHPPRVRAAIERHRRGLDGNTALYLRDREVELEDAARRSAADYLGTRPDEIALTDSTTMGLAMVYGRLRLEPDDEIVTTEHDFYATSESLRLRSEVDGVTIRQVRLYDIPDRASVDRIVSTIAGALGPRTRALAITWVHSSSGVKLPLREIAGAVADANRSRGDRDRILLCVDGVHGFGVEEKSPVELGADVFVSGCHKWLFGPRGTGIVWAAPHAWARMAPLIPSFDGRAYVAWIEGRRPTDVPPGPMMTPGGYHSFEHRWALPQAFEDLREHGDRRAIARRTYALAARMKEGLAEIPGMRVKTPRDEALSSGLVCAVIPKLPAGTIVDGLREEHRVIASVTPYVWQYVRFGPSVANSEADVDRALEAVAAVVA